MECITKGLADETQKTYRGIWNRFCRWMNITELHQLNTQTIRHFTAKLRDDGKVNTTINTYLRHLRAILNWMAEDDQGMIEPVRVKLVKHDSEIKDVYTATEMKRILAVPKTGSSYTTWRCWLISNMLYYTGMRSATLRRVKWSDLDSKTWTMRLQHTKTKARIIPVGTELAKALMSFKRRFNSDLEGNIISTATGLPIGARTMQKAMRDYHTSCAVVTNSMHQYRRTFITKALNEGKDSLLVARMVGHRDLQMIHKHYAPHQVEMLRDVVE